MELRKIDQQKRISQELQQHAQQLAARVKELEEREIGRPSTYASIIGTILARDYVYKKGTALVPTCRSVVMTAEG